MRERARKARGGIFTWSVARVVAEDGVHLVDQILRRLVRRFIRRERHVVRRVQRMMMMMMILFPQS